MRRLRAVLLGLLAIVVGLPLLAVGSSMAWFWLNTVHASWHQRMTLIIETPAGEVTGASVQEALFTGTRGELRHIMGVNGSTGGYGFRGEAAVVELAPGRYLFALLTGGEGGLGAPGLNLAALAGRPQRLYPATEAAVAAVKALPKDQPLTLTPDLYPLLVTFDDINDPKTVRQVDPDDLGAAFGPGVRLKAVTLEVTDAPVTEGKVEAVLGDLKTIGSSGPKPIKFSPKFPVDELDPNEKYLSVLTLSTEVYK